MLFKINDFKMSPFSGETAFAEFQVQVHLKINIFRTGSQAAKNLRRPLGERPAQGGSALRTAQGFIQSGAKNFPEWKTEQ